MPGLATGGNGFVAVPPCGYWQREAETLVGVDAVRDGPVLERQRARGQCARRRVRQRARRCARRIVAGLLRGSESRSQKSHRNGAKHARPITLHKYFFYPTSTAP